VPRVGGTKNPSVAAIVALQPDLVLANEEENRPADIDALRAAGIEVDVTWVRTLDAAFAELRRVLARIGAAPAWLDEAESVWAPAYDGPRRSALVPIWRRPWMAVGSDTFAGDVLSRLGIDNVLGSSGERYPRFSLADVECDVVVLPDEPYAFSASDGPEAFSAPSVLVSGRDLTWYGPSLVSARAALMEQLW
jgi:ABC-type Fe3+-hydroxamate transport system substrate-binding protein